MRKKERECVCMCVRVCECVCAWYEEGEGETTQTQECERVCSCVHHCVTYSIISCTFHAHLLLVKRSNNTLYVLQLEGDMAPMWRMTSSLRRWLVWWSGSTNLSV